MTARGCTRALRAAVFAAVCVLLAALGHVMMSGDHVPPVTLLAGWAAVGAAGWGLAGRERGPAPVVAVAVVAQTLLHAAFSTFSPATAAPATGPVSMYAGAMGSGAMGSGGMDMGSMRHEHTMGSPHMGPGHTAPAFGGDTSLGMLSAHLLAALLCGLWLAYGERAVFRLLRAVGGWLAAPLRVLLLHALPPHRPPLRVRRRRRDDRAPRLLLVHAITSRGPPAGTAAV